MAAFPQRPIVPGVPIVPPDITAAKQAFQTLNEKFTYWKIPNAHRPFEKNVVSVLGMTSSGKSSLINYFFGMHVKRVAQQEIDTQFTIVETVPEEEFKRWVPDYRRKPGSELGPPHVVSEKTGTSSDPFRNVGYVVLDANQTCSRYDQFESFASVFRKHQLIQSVLINEFYLYPVYPTVVDGVDIRKQTILIDSPGFTAESDARKLEGNLRILQFIYQLSQLTLFCICSDSLSLVAGQVHLLELSLIYSFHGDAHAKIDQSIAVHDQHLGKSAFTISSFYTIIAAQLGLGFGSSSSSTTPALPTDYTGASHWDKIRFVMTKMDRVAEPALRKGAGAEAAFYELGIVLATNLKTMRPPVFSQCLAISLPGHSSPDDTRDLPLLLSEIRALNLFSSTRDRLEASIQAMCDDLRAAIKTSFMGGALSFQDKALVETLYAESLERCKARTRG